MSSVLKGRRLMLSIIIVMYVLTGATLNAAEFHHANTNVSKLFSISFGPVLCEYFSYNPYLLLILTTWTPVLVPVLPMMTAITRWIFSVNYFRNIQTISRSHI